MAVQKVNALNCDELASASWRYRLVVDWTANEPWDRIPTSSALVSVLADLVHLGDDKVVSDSAEVPFAKFLEGLPGYIAPSRSATRSASSTPNPSVSEQQLMEYPWLVNYLSAGRNPVPNRPSVSPATSSHAAEPDQGELNYQDIEETLAELERKRAEWLADEEGTQEDFRVGLLGGAWVQRTKGKAADAFQGRCANKDASDWAERVGLNQTRRYELSFDGERAASVLASVWCHKMQYWYSLYLDADSYDIRDVPRDAKHYQEPADFTALEKELGSKQQAAITQLRKLAPKRS